jgi:Cu2+-exporting ATPase
VADGAQPSGWRLVARFAWEERLRSEVKDALEALRAQGLRLALLSGDATPRVEAVAKQLGIGEALGDAAPEDKLRAIQRWTDAGERVLYVGDGLNDAPALGGATVSLALGAESAFARDAADLVSVRRDLRAVPFAVGVAKCLQRRLRRNIFWAVGYNVAAVPLAVAGLATPWLAALGMTLSSLVVLVQAQRLAGDGDRWGTALWKA